MGREPLGQNRCFRGAVGVELYHGLSLPQSPVHVYRRPGPGTKGRWGVSARTIADQIRGSARHTVLCAMPYRGLTGSRLRVAMRLAQDGLATQVADRHYIRTPLGRDVAELLRSGKAGGA